MNKTLLKELCQEIKGRNVDKDSCAVIILSLKNDDDFATMLKWIQQNPEAGQEQIFDKLDEI